MLKNPENKEQGFDRDFGLSRQERLRIEAEGLKGRKCQEIIRRTENPQAALWAGRQILSSEEGRETNQPPNFYVATSLLSTIDDRLSILRLGEEESLIKGWGLEEIVYGQAKGALKEEKKLGKNERRGLVKGLIEVKNESWARWRILEAYRQHRMAGMDLEQVTVGIFTSLQKVYPEAGHFATIGRAKESLPGAEKLGVMVDNALRAWCDVGEREKEEGGFGNIFGDKRYEQTYQKALDYVTGRIIKEGLNIDEKEREYSPYWSDAQDAARLGLEIFRLLDLDVRYDLSKKGVGPKEAKEYLNRLRAYLLGEDELREKCKFEGGQSSGDLAKIHHFILRQMNEFVRDHPRSIGAPAVIGCFPNLTLDFMRMTTIKLPIKIKTDKGEEKSSFSLWELWREHEVSFRELPWGQKEWEEGPDILERHRAITKEQKREILLKGKAIEGVSQDAYDVPYTLQHFYAVGTVFNAITRKDWDKALGDCQNPNYLYGLNKGFETAFEMMADGSGLSGKAEGEAMSTMDKIRQLAKVNFLIGVLTANLPGGSRKELERVTGKPLSSREAIKQINRSVGAEATASSEIVEGVIQAGKESGFLSSTNPEEREVLEKEEKLIKAGIKKRRGFLPGEANKIVRRFFKPDELEAIKKSGLYSLYQEV